MRMRAACAALCWSLVATVCYAQADDAGGGWEKLIGGAMGGGFAIAVAWKLIDYMIRQQSEQLEAVTAALAALGEQINAQNEKMDRCPERIKAHLSGILIDEGETVHG